MVIRQRRHPREELARRGKELYESQIRQQVEANHFGKIVAIDVETGIFEVDDDTLVASDRLLERCPDAQTGFSARRIRRQEWCGNGVCRIASAILQEGLCPFEVSLTERWYRLLAIVNHQV